VGSIAMKARTLVLLALTVLILSCKPDKSTRAPQMVVLHREGHTFSYDPAACEEAKQELVVAEKRLAQCRHDNPVEFTRCDGPNAAWSTYKHRAFSDCTPHSQGTSRVPPRKTSS
jgi:hypothetical protein